MTPAAQIATTIEILTEILDSPRPADGIVSAYFRGHRYLGSTDRRYVIERLYRILRHFHRLSWHLKEVNPRNLVLADMCMVRHQDPRDFFGRDQYAPEELSSEDIIRVKFLSKQRLHHRDMPDHIKLECPEWAVESLQGHLKHNFSSVMKAMLLEAQVDLRVNTLKTDRETLQKELETAGIVTKITPHSPWGLRIEGKRQPLGQNPLFRKGHFEIQDEGSQMVTVLANPKPGMRVFDFCAGAGGKSLALGAMMKNKGMIMATDISQGRLKRSKERFKRAGMHNATTYKLEKENDKWLKRHFKKYDIVLADAPCTGTGTWRRDPDKKWRDIGPNLHTLLDLQSRIINSAAKLVKNGGRLVYATCSLLPEENHLLFEEFIKNNEEFSIVDLSKEDYLAGLPISSQYMELNPADHKTDGFFCAIAVRNIVENKKEEENEKTK